MSQYGYGPLIYACLVSLFFFVGPAEQFLGVGGRAGGVGWVGGGPTHPRTRPLEYEVGELRNLTCPAWASRGDAQDGPAAATHPPPWLTRRGN